MTTGTPERRFAALEGRDDFVLQVKDEEGRWILAINQEYLRCQAGINRKMDAINRMVYDERTQPVEDSNAL